MLAGVSHLSGRSASGLLWMQAYAASALSISTVKACGSELTFGNFNYRTHETQSSSFFVRQRRDSRLNMGGQTVVR